MGGHSRKRCQPLSARPAKGGRPHLTPSEEYLLGLCRTDTFTDVTKASVPGWPIVVVSQNPAYRAAQYDEAQEAHLAKGSFHKAAYIVVNLVLKARPKPD